MKDCLTCKFDIPYCPYLMKYDIPPLPYGVSCSEWTEFDIATTKKEIKELKSKFEFLDNFLRHTDHYPKEVR